MNNARRLKKLWASAYQGNKRQGTAIKYAKKDSIVTKRVRGSLIKICWAYRAYPNAIGNPLSPPAFVALYEYCDCGIFTICADMEAVLMIEPPFSLPKHLFCGCFCRKESTCQIDSLEYIACRGIVIIPFAIDRSGASIKSVTCVAIIRKVSAI